jgi:5-methylcytosine-specific restriction endonuclease McrA
MSNPRRTNSTRRNKLRARVLREESICWLCGEAVDTKLQAGLPQSPEVDELLPVSLGGDPYDRANVRLAHRLCNQKRSNKLPNEAIEAAKLRAKNEKPLRKSREW